MTEADIFFGIALIIGFCMFALGVCGFVFKFASLAFRQAGYSERDDK